MNIYINMLNPVSVEPVEERFRNPFCGYCYYAAATPEERQEMVDVHHSFLFNKACDALPVYEQALIEKSEVEIWLGCDHGSNVLIQVLLNQDDTTLAA